MIVKQFSSSDDIEEIKAVAEKAFSSTSDSRLDDWFSFSEMRKAIKEQTGACIKILLDNKIAGVVYAEQESPINGKEGKEKWVIVLTAVEPSQSGKGVGTRLLNAIEEVAINYGALKMFVYTNKGDDQVVNFYKKNGYVDAGSIKDYQYGRNNSAVFLLKHLTNEF
jgi:ribosomal protein S18 acetylase RimI-like enzyme